MLEAMLRMRERWPLAGKYIRLEDRGSSTDSSPGATPAVPQQMLPNSYSPPIHFPIRASASTGHSPMSLHNMNAPGPMPSPYYPQSPEEDYNLQFSR